MRYRTRPVLWRRIWSFLGGPEYPVKADHSAFLGLDVLKPEQVEKLQKIEKHFKEALKKNPVVVTEKTTFAPLDQYDPRTQPIATFGSNYPYTVELVGDSTIRKKKLSSYQVRARQQTLRDHGFYNGPLDGIYGPLMDEAEVRYRFAQQSAKPAWVRYGVYSRQILAGTSVASALELCNPLWGIPPNAHAYIGTRRVDPGYIIQPGDYIEFHRVYGHAKNARFYCAKCAQKSLPDIFCRECREINKRAKIYR